MQIFFKLLDKNISGLILSGGPLNVYQSKKVKFNKKTRILDIGCGTGSTSQSLSKLVGENGLITGIDISEPILSFAKNQLENRNIKNIEQTFKLTKSIRKIFNDKNIKSI